jgi:hypothetical protein
MLKVNPNFAVDICPWFLTNMPGRDPNQAAPSFLNTDCARPLKPAKSDKEYQDSLMSAMKRLNITVVANGDAPMLHKWQEAAPGRVIPSLRISSPEGNDRSGF